MRSLISQAALTLCAPAFLSNDMALNQLEEAAKNASEAKLVSAVEEMQVGKYSIYD